ncbi:hypothetical protein FSP39_002399 [Pinctada imbricata]|uniref:Uncharacterized protein n=1 Tax=Pinctada imbricata TaxID=66713 RepID=A0AA89C208_PINIB|nr:hypothetical protein FSP39_002399 [Pinctada imbricata]
MSLGLLTSTIQVLKKVKEQTDPYAQSLANGITEFIKPGTDYSYLTNRKTRLQLIRLSAVVCGIELCYAAETAFVTPILLKLGVPMSLMTLVCIKVPHHHVIGIALTIIGVAVLDFSCDAAQSPSRAYLLDISMAEDHSPGLTTFTVMAGLGGSVGYLMGGINWNVKSFGESLGGHVRIVFSIVLLIFIICVFITYTSFKEVPLSEIGFTEEQMQKKKKKKGKSKYTKFTNEETDTEFDEEIRTEALKTSRAQVSSYGSLSKEARVPTINVSHEDEDYDPKASPEVQNDKVSTKPKVGDTKPLEDNDSYRRLSAIQLLTEIKLKTYLMSIFKMPRPLLILCLTNLFCWMSLVCFSLYFTDFVGQAVYGGDPKSPTGSEKHQLYDDGVRLGSFGMSLYSLSCAMYSLCIEKLVSRFKAKPVYICGQLVYTLGMVVLACTRSRIATIIMSPSAGIMYATLFTMPYLLVAHYHTRTEFTTTHTEEERMENIRGLGTDIALVSSMVFLAQFLLSAFMGTVVDAVGSTVAVIVAAAILSCLGALTATQVTYYEM